MEGPLDEQYFTWLYGRVDSVKARSSAQTRWGLMRQLYNKQFVSLVPNDDNRVADGRELRNVFLAECGIDSPDPHWLSLGCSMLEMMLALAGHLSFFAGGECPAWFWHLIEVLDLYQYTDSKYDADAENDIDHKLNTVIWRRYKKDGSGGLFPLRNPQVNQREAEIWYQLNAYLLEQF